MSRDSELVKRVEEMISEWQSSTSIYPMLQHHVADFALSEIRCELESLRETRCHRVVDGDAAASGWNAAVDFVRAEIDRRLAALSEEKQNSRTVALASETPARDGRAVEGAADRAIRAPELTRSAALDLDPRLADAEALERAAEIMRKRGCLTIEGVILDQAADLRISVTRLPRDWADEVASAWWSDPLSHSPEGVAALIRARFGPLVELAESIEFSEEMYPSLGAEARAALRALREGSHP